MFVVHFILGEYYLLLFFTKVNKSIESTSSAQENSSHLQPKAREEPHSTPPVGSAPYLRITLPLFPSYPRNEWQKKGYQFPSYVSALASTQSPKYTLYIAGVISKTPRIQRSKIRSSSKEKSGAHSSRTTPQNQALPEDQTQGISLLHKHPPFPRVKAPTFRRAKNRPTVGRQKNLQ